MQGPQAEQIYMEIARRWRETAEDLERALLVGQQLAGFTLLFESHSTAPAGGIGTSPSYQGRQSLRSKLVPALLNKFGHGSTLASRRSRAMWRALVSCFAIFLGQSCFRSTPPSAGAPSPSHVGLGGQGTAWGISTRRRGGAVR